MQPWPPIGENIARMRHLAELTQEELAEKAGVSVDLIPRLTAPTNRLAGLLPTLITAAERVSDEGDPIFAPRINHLR